MMTCHGDQSMTPRYCDYHRPKCNWLLWSLDWRLSCDRHCGKSSS